MARNGGMVRNGIAFGAWAALAAVAGLAFLNNVVLIARWWGEFAGTGGDPSVMDAALAGPFGWLDWTAVDQSAVSTFIPFAGCLLMARGYWTILRRRTADPDEFPFPQSMDQFNVALGLLGTLWGIILIGYFRLDKVAMSDLMRCLHTALFSTLVAVAWVFVVDHPFLRPALRRALKEAGLDKPADSDVLAAVDKLTRDLTAASEEVKRMGAEIREMNEKFERVREVLRG